MSDPEEKPILSFKVRCHYVTHDAADCDIYAETEEQAKRIAERRFRDEHTERCKLTGLTVDGAKKQTCASSFPRWDLEEAGSGKSPNKQPVATPPGDPRKDQFIVDIARLRSPDEPALTKLPEIKLGRSFWLWSFRKIRD